jgi:hypothetical protein
MTFAKLTLTLAIIGGLAEASSTALAAKPDYQQHIDFAIGNHTGPDQLNCPEQYAATQPAAAFSGGRAALMTYAIAAAKANNYDYAFRLTLITQCHNGGAQSQIAAAGKMAVAEYLKTR